ncbi:MAG: helix-turn-helix domain-containing protein [Lentisphaeria bacterium]
MIDPRQLSQAIAAVERRYGCRVSFHDYTGRLQVIPEAARVHDNFFCATVKSHYPPGGGACAFFDFRLVQNRIEEKPEPFFKCCPAGVLEAVVPVLVGGRLAGALFAGPFRNASPLPAEVFQAGRRAGFPDAERLKPRLAALPPEEWAELLALAALVAAQLSALAENQGAAGKPGDRREQVLNFLAAHLHRPTGLPELAAHLRLSVSRSSQVVRALFACSFPQLLTRHRLDYARSLLAHSRLKITAVALQCGFRDAAYFHRVFHHREGCSPRAYRRRQESAAGRPV